MGAPRGNLFAIGNTGGRPPMFETPEELANKIAAYLDWEDECKDRDKKGNGKGLYTISGCALFLGFATRQSFYDLEKRDEFSYIMQRFKLFMTHWNEQKLYYMGTFPGSKLWLTNFAGYTEETTQTVRSITEVKPEVVMTGAPKFASNESEVDGL